MMRTRIHHGFSLIELVVAIVILGIMAAVVAPRMVMREDRRERQAAVAVRDLLSAAARREVMSTGRVVLDFDAGSQTLTLLSERVEDDARLPRSAMPLAPDPLVPAVTLEPLSLGEATARGLRIDGSSGWRLDLRSSTGRPDVVLLLVSARGTPAYTVALAPGATAALMMPGDARNQVVTAQAIDLDAAGLRDQPW